MNRKDCRNRSNDHRNRNRSRGLHLETLNPRLLLDGAGLLTGVLQSLLSSRRVLSSDLETIQNQSKDVVQTLETSCETCGVDFLDESQGAGPNDISIIDGPTLETPTFEEPELFDDPMLDMSPTPPTDPPVFSDPMMGDPGLSDPGLTDPGFSEPSFSDPMFQDPALSDPILDPPTFEEPNPDEFLSGDPLFDPTFSDPTFSDPTFSDPTFSDPTMGDPTRDPFSTDPIPDEFPLTDPDMPLPDGSVPSVPHDPTFLDPSIPPSHLPEFDPLDPSRIDLELSQTVSSTHAEIGDSIAWTLTLTNNAEQATADATGVEVMNFIPPGFEIVSVNDGGTGTFEHGLWRLSEPLPPGESRSLQIITEISRVEPESIWLQGANANLEVDGQFDVHFEGSRAAFAPAWVSGPIANPMDPVGPGRIIIGNAFGESTLDVTPTDTYEDLVQKINLVSGSVRAQLVPTEASMPGDMVSMPGEMVSMPGDIVPEFRLMIVTNGFVPTHEEGVVRAPVMPNISVEGTNLWGYPEALAVGQSFASVPADPDTPFGNSDAMLTFVSGTDRIPVSVHPGSTYRELAEQINSQAGAMGSRIQAKLLDDPSGMSLLEISVEYKTLSPLLMNGASFGRPASIPGVVIARNPAGAVEFHAGEFSAGLEGETAFSSMANISSRNASFEVGEYGELRLQGSAVHLSPNGDLLLQDYRETDAMLTGHAEVVFAHQMDVDSHPANDNGDQSEDDEASAMLFVDPKVEVDAHVPVELLTSVNTNTAQAGESVTWTVLVKTDASATAPAEGIRIQNLVPAHTTSTLITVSDKGQIIDGGWSLVEPLAPGDSASITIVTTINHDAPVGTVIRSEPIFVDSATRELFPSSDAPAELVVAGSDVDLELDYSADRTIVNPFEEVRWTMTLTNNNELANAVATNVLVENKLPEGFVVEDVFVSGMSGGSEYAAGIWTVPHLAPGESVSVDLITRVPDHLPVGVDLTAMANVLHVDQQDIDSMPGVSMDASEDDEAFAFVVVEPLVDLELQQQTELIDGENGQALRVELAVTNNAEHANAEASGVVVRSELPTELAVLRAVASSGEVDYPRFEWTLTEPLAPGATETIVLVVDLVDAPPGNVMLTTRSEVAAVDQLDVDSEPGNASARMGQDDDVVSEIFVEPVMQLDAFVFTDVESVRAGETVTWSVVVRNDPRSNQVADFFVVDGLLPPEVTPISSSASSGEVTDGVWRLSAPLEPGGQETLSIETQVDPSLPGEYVISSAPAIRPIDLGDGTFPAVFAEPAKVTVESVIDLELNQALTALHNGMISIPADDGAGDMPDDTAGSLDDASGELQASEMLPTQVIVGELIALDFELTNNPAAANSQATGVSVAIDLPDELMIVSVEGEGVYENGMWTVPAMAPGGWASLEIVAKLQEAADGVLVVSSQVLTADQQDIDSLAGGILDTESPMDAPIDDASDTPVADDVGVVEMVDGMEDDEAESYFETIGNVVDLELDATVSSEMAEAGDSLVWTLLLHNNAERASAAATGVRVTNFMPDGVVVQHVTGSHHSWVEGNTWVLGQPLEPGETAHLLMLTSVDDRHPGQAALTSTAFVASANESDVDSTPGNVDTSEDDTVDTTVTIAGVVDVELKASVDRFLVEVGEPVNWTITVANNPRNANMMASSLVVETGLPSAVSIVDVQSPEGTDFSEGRWTIDRLAPGEIQVLEIQTVPEVPGEYTSVVEVTHVEQPDFDSVPGNQVFSFAEDDQSTVWLAVLPDAVETEPVDTTPPVIEPPEPVAETPMDDVEEPMVPIDPTPATPAPPQPDDPPTVGLPPDEVPQTVPDSDVPVMDEAPSFDGGLDEVAPPDSEPIAEEPIAEEPIAEEPVELPPEDQLPDDEPVSEMPDPPEQESTVPSAPASDVPAASDEAAAPNEELSEDETFQALEVGEAAPSTVSIRRQADVVTIVGTPNDEEFVLDMSESVYLLSINGDVNKFDPSDVSEIHIGGGHGSDSITVIGSPLNETANMFGRNAELYSEAYVVKTYDFDATTLTSFDGNDYGNIFGSSDDDVLQGFAYDSTMETPDAVNRMIGFDRVDAFGRGGNDVASIYGGNDADLFYVMPTHEVMLADGSTQYTKGFERVDAFGREGEDYVRLIDSPGTDRVRIDPTREILQGSGRLRVTKGFEEVDVVSESGGADLIELVDLRTVDSLFAEGSNVTLRSPERELTIEGYASVDASSGENEQPTRDVSHVDFVLRTFGSWLEEQ